MDAPSMVQRDGDKLIVRRVVSGDEVFLNQLNDSPSPASSSKDQHQSSASNQSLADSLKIYPGEEDLSKFGLILEDSSGPKGTSSEAGDCIEQQLPQCKIKRNYSCSNCTYFTQNPRKYLTHLRDVHGEKIIINECKRCLYASRHYQKLVRHMKMVHGSTDGIKTPFSSRRRGTFRKEYFKKNKFKMNTNLPESDFYNQNRASYLEQLNKMLRGAAGGGVGGESAAENQIYLANYKHGLTLADPSQQLSQLKGSSNINIFADNGGTSSLGCASTSGDSSSQDLLAMLQHNLVDKNKQLTITPTSMASGSGGSGAEMVTKQKKKVRPIPDLIPLHSIGQLHLRGEVGKTYHLNPEVTIKSRAADSDNNNSIDAAGTSGKTFVIDDESPINLTADQNGDKSLQHQCIFCHIMVRTTDDLALHLRTFHSEELFTLLLQKKPEDSGQADLQSYTAESLTIDIWKRLLENNKAILEEQESRENDSEMQSGQYSNDEDDAETVESAISKNETYLGVETAPGYGEVTSKYNLDDGTTQTSVMKKVFKCPHCSFWASTASRFHVHIVGHLNKKPFECSLCSYRSNWRWDITKHIRLKTIRDPSHKNAGVLMNDETGRRNYTKYNRYITLMKVTDNSFKDSSSSSKSMIETSQADYLAMCKAAGDSPASLNSLAKMYSSDELAQAFNLASMNQMARFEPEMLQTLVGMPKPLPTEDAKSSPQKAYKCKKCNFKNPFRELVLLHIRSTHMAVDKSANSSEAELDLMPCEVDPDVEPIETATSATNSTLNPQSPLRTSLSPLSGVSPRSESGGNIGGLTGASTSASTTPSVTSGSASGYNSNNYTTNATLIGVGLNFTQAVANDNRLGTTYTLSNTIPSVVFGGEVNRTINTASTTTQSTTISASSASASTTNTNTTTTPPSTSTTTTTTPAGGKGQGASNSWRPSAPYRCGHCHQVSNWKHVIQRHCRLKHNGNVLIEMVNGAKQSQNVTDTRNLKKVRKPFQSFDSVSQDIPVQPVTLHPIELVPEVSLIVQDVPLLQPPPLAIIPIENLISSGAIPPNVTIAPVRMRTPPMTTTFINLTDDSSLEPPSSFPTPMQTDSAPTSDANTEEPYEEPATTHRMKRYQCDACPYETDSKTQFAYHKSFHKPRGDPYKCNICSYNVTKKHLLIQHQKTHQERSVPSTSSSGHHVAKPKVKPAVPAAVGIGELSLVMGNETKSTGLTPADILDLTKKIRDEVSITPAGGTITETIHIDEKIVYYCAYCPARYLDESEIVIHQNRHTQEEKYKCELCSFSTCDESGVTTHRNVHSANYRRGTKELRKLNIESDKHPRRRLIQIGDAEKIWVVQADYERLHNMQADSPEPEPDPQPRRSTRSKNNSPSITAAVTEITKEPKVYSCEHCDYTDSSECSFKDHVKFHFSAILFPKVNKYAALDRSGEPFKLIATAKDDPKDAFELNYDAKETAKAGAIGECNSTDRIIIEI
ncbi:uncharacterized protein LOC5565895 isoform X4 [Aedes aegypti]|uniref:C2H2-type domain-containing protein n=1 Tax=Aedes aegypti TaxID=7159 RepID=A0A6I8TUV7_AEDAE|nr:uncharacterized protein LOC5565895 isoform X4 [Aedes aegypti]